MSVSSSSILQIFGYCGVLTTKYLERAIELDPLSEIEKDRAFALHGELLEKPLVKSGEARKDAWNAGWNENFNQLQNSGLEALIPRYFGKFPYVRYKGEFYGADGSTELRFLRTIILNELEHVLSNFEAQNIVEFGCGTGQNLFFLHDLFPNINFLGTDWSSQSQEIIDFAKKKLSIENVSSLPTFDYFKPNFELSLGRNTGVITVASLEQVGADFGKFLDYLIFAKPNFVLHIEPEEDLLNADSPFDQSSIQYMRKRGYLNGLLNELKRREELGEIRILSAKRTDMGSFPMDGYSVMAWTPF